MEQPLSVALTVEPFRALPWLPPHGANFVGAASFIRLGTACLPQGITEGEAFVLAKPRFTKAKPTPVLLRLRNYPSSEREARGRNGTKALQKQ
jgi:hypothetical protein